MAEKSMFWYPEYMYTDLSYGFTEALRLAGFDDTGTSEFTKCCMDVSVDPKLEYKYKCGLKDKSNEMEYDAYADISYNCNEVQNICKTIKLVLDDETSNLYTSTDTTDNNANTPGIKIVQKDSDDKISVNCIFKFSDALLNRSLIKAFNRDSNGEYEGASHELIFSENGEDMLDDMAINNNSMKMSTVKYNCLISPGGKFKLFLENGLLKLAYKENDCQYDTEEKVYIGKNNGTNTASIYKIDDKTDFLGKLYHVDEQGGYREIENPGYDKSTKEYKIILGVGSNGQVKQKYVDTTKTICENACTGDVDCAGYQFNTMNRECKTFRRGDMYPYNKENKKQDEYTNTYVRVPNNNSTVPTCKNTKVHSLMTDELIHYKETQPPMNSDEDCGISKLINDEINNLTSSDVSDITDESNSISITETDLEILESEILDEIRKLTDKEKNLLNQMGTNVYEMEKSLLEYKDIREKKIEGKEINILDGQYEDSSKKLNKEMSFLIGTSIVSVMLLLVAVNLQKK